jgi:NADPH:quinone reductase-like Zn-dependent oxidoreductase
MATMKAVRMHAFGDVDVLHYEEVERPVPQAGEALVQVRAAGVNPVDWGARSYPMPSTTGAAGARLPYILGWDLAGDVVALGAGVTQFAVGEAVYGMPRFPGEAKAYSEYTAVPVSDLAHKPERLTYQEAAAVPMAALIAWQALFDTAALDAGQTVLMPGGAGGVGHLAIQLAKWKGAQVITTTSTRNVAFVRELGADLVIDYTQQALTDTAQEVDVVLDTMGEDVLRQAFGGMVKRGGWVVSLLRAHRALGEQLAEQAGAHFAFILVHPSGEQLAEIANLCDAGLLNVYLDAVFPLQDVAKAHKLSEGRHVRGKLVLSVA